MFRQTDVNYTAHITSRYRYYRKGILGLYFHSYGFNQTRLMMIIMFTIYVPDYVGYLASSSMNDNDKVHTSLFFHRVIINRMEILLFFLLSSKFIKLTEYSDNPALYKSF